MTFETAEQMRAAARAGESQRAVALRFGVARSLLQIILAGKRWTSPAEVHRSTRRRRSPSEFAAAFWAKAEKTAGCWIWTGDRHARDGYGRAQPPGRRLMKAHRVAYELVHGPIPDGKVVMHTCDNPPCVNPAHLTVGTQLDNVNDMLAKGRGSPPPPSPNRRTS